MTREQRAFISTKSNAHKVFLELRSRYQPGEHISNVLVAINVLHNESLLLLIQSHPAVQGNWKIFPQRLRDL
mgnify:CR=1 FL=1